MAKDDRLKHIHFFEIFNALDWRGDEEKKDDKRFFILERLHKTLFGKSLSECDLPHDQYDKADIKSKEIEEWLDCEVEKQNYDFSSSEKIYGYRTDWSQLPLVRSLHGMLFAQYDECGFDSTILCVESGEGKDWGVFEIEVGGDGEVLFFHMKDPDGEHCFFNMNSNQEEELYQALYKRHQYRENN